MSEPSIILVTGSSGFLGQHVIKMLQERDKKVKEIRCLDVKPYENKLGHEMNHGMKILTGCITNERVIDEAIKGVDMIIHCAAVIDLNIFPDEKLMKKVNVDGTQKLINASIDHGVRYFIHVSTSDVVVGPDPIYYGTETTTPPQTNPLIGYYAKTKRISEEIVLNANNQHIPKLGAPFRSLVIRPTVLYGEQDVHFIPKALALTKENKGILQRLDNIFMRMQTTYVGNAAWAILKAKEAIQVDASIGGEAFFITDDSEIKDPFDFLTPMVEKHGMSMSTYSAPYVLVLFFLTIISAVVAMIKPFYQIDLPESWNLKTLKFTCNTAFFNRTKSTLRLNYDPIFTPEISMERSMQYYNSLVL